MMETVLITGANRGIGLALTKEFLNQGYRVLGTYRGASTNDELTQLASNDRLGIYPLDVVDEKAVSALADSLSSYCIDILFNNAGIFGPQDQSLEAVDSNGWLQTFAVNSIAPLIVSRAFLPHLLKASKPRILTITSQLGALSFPGSGYYAYSSSKAAANKVIKLMASDLAAKGIIVCPLHPGWVRTDMGGPNAEISAEQSARGMVKLASELTMEQSGQFYTWEGKVHEW